MTQTRKQTRMVAVSGKGGTGKSTLTVLMARAIMEESGRSLLLVDADPSVNLTLMLGMDESRTVGALRERLRASGEALQEASDEDKHIREVLADECLQTSDRFSLLTMGRPEGPGCFCGVNSLLRFGVESLSKRFDITIIDCEAGMEQVNRRVTKGIDDMVLAVEPTLRSVHTATYIRSIAERHGVTGSFTTHVVLNKARDARTTEMIRQALSDLDLDLALVVPQDDQIAELDARGSSLLELSPESPSVTAVRSLVAFLRP